MNEKFPYGHDVNAYIDKAFEQMKELLLKIIPQDLWEPVNHQWILFGREICNAKNPKCGDCFLIDVCPTRK